VAGEFLNRALHHHSYRYYRDFGESDIEFGNVTE
jgi:hypothetical protein